MARNPSILIADAIGAELNRHLGIVAAKATGLDYVNLGGWAKIDTTKIGKVDGLTLAGALGELNETANKPVALIIDEAQHSLTNEEGEAAMTALKSAHAIAMGRLSFALGFAQGIRGRAHQGRPATPRFPDDLYRFLTGQQLPLAEFVGWNALPFHCDARRARAHFRHDLADHCRDIAQVIVLGKS